MLIGLHFRILKIRFISPFTLIIILNRTRMYIQTEISIYVISLIFTCFLYQVSGSSLFYIAFNAFEKNLIKLFSTLLCTYTYVLVCIKQCFYSDSLVIRVFFFVNMVDLLKLMLFSAMTIKVNQHVFLLVK